MSAHFQCLQKSQSASYELKQQLVVQHTTHKQACSHVQDGPKLGILAACVQIVLFITIIPTLVKYYLTARVIGSQLCLIFLNAVPPIMPTASAMLGVRTIMRVRQQHLHVADPQKLLASAQTDMLLFDKTGTLTIGQVWEPACSSHISASEGHNSSSCMQQCHVTAFVTN